MLDDKHKALEAAGNTLLKATSVLGAFYGLFRSLRALARKVNSMLKKPPTRPDSVLHIPPIKNLGEAVNAAFALGGVAVISITSLAKGKISASIELASGEQTNASIALLPGHWLLVRLPFPGTEERGIIPHTPPE